MNNTRTIPIERIYNLLDSLCRDLDFLADPDIEKKMGCTLDCCIVHGIITDFFEMDENRTPEILLVEQIIGRSNLEMFRLFEEPFNEAMYYGGKDFSQNPWWKNFSQLAKDLSNGIQKSVGEYKLKNPNIKFENTNFKARETL